MSSSTRGFEVNNSDKPAKSFLGDTQWAKHLGVCAVIAAFAFVLSMLFHGSAGGDRDGEGLVMMGLSIFAVPIVGISGALAFIFRRTIISDILGGVVLFITVFFTTVWLFG